MNPTLIEYDQNSYRTLYISKYTFLFKQIIFYFIYTNIHFQWRISPKKVTYIITRSPSSPASLICLHNTLSALYRVCGTNRCLSSLCICLHLQAVEGGNPTCPWPAAVVELVMEVGGEGGGLLSIDSKQRMCNASCQAVSLYPFNPFGIALSLISHASTKTIILCHKHTLDASQRTWPCNHTWAARQWAPMCGIL